MNNEYFILLAVIAFIYIINIVRKKKFSIKESFWWVMLSLLMLILAIFPYSIDKLAKLLNISYPPSLLFIVCILFLIFMNLRESKRTSELQTKVIDLGQELAILKQKILQKQNK